MRSVSNPFNRLALVALTAWCTTAGAGVTDITIDAALPWNGFINVYQLPTTAGADRGGYVFGQFLGTNLAALPASILGDTVTMAPNGTFGVDPGDTSNPFWADWWAPDSSGGLAANKVIEANLYVDTGLGGPPLAGETVRWSGIASASSLAAPYVAYAFIREFTNGYGATPDEVSVPLVAGQAFWLEKATASTSPVQFGFAFVGPNADAQSVGRLGSITISAVPEPSTLALALLGVLGIAAWSRRRA
jgi:PEP-CTERM motif